jgi:hypothetical protein
MAATSAQMDAADQRRFEREESAYYRLSPAARTRRAQLWMRLAQGERTAETLRREYAADINGVQVSLSCARTRTPTAGPAALHAALSYDAGGMWRLALLRGLRSRPDKRARSLASPWSAAQRALLLVASPR